MRDKTGKEIKVGSLVDIPVYRMATGLVVKVSDSALEIPGQGIMPPHIVLQIQVTIPAGPSLGIGCYVVQDPPPNSDQPVNEEKKVIEFPN